MEENKTLLETRQHLEDVGFQVTKAQLEYKLKDWGFRKKIPKQMSDTVWQYVGHRTAKRRRLGKDSQVMLNQQVVDPAKVLKETSRHQPTSFLKFTQVAMSPKTPEGIDISVRTPPQIILMPAWPSGLPWLQFESRLSQFSDWTLIVTSLEETGITGIPLQLERTTDLTVLSVAESLFGKAFEMLNQQYRSDHETEHYSLYSIEAGIEYRSEHPYGHSESGSDRDPDGDAMAQLPSWRIIDWLLRCGQDPNHLICGKDGHLMTPLQMAVQLRCPRLILLLLSKKADANISHNGSKPPLLTLLLNYKKFGSDRLSLVKRFLEAGASVSSKGGSSYLLAALKGVEPRYTTSDLDLMDVLVQEGAELSGHFCNSSNQDWLVRRFSVLAYAGAIAKESMALECLKHLLENAGHSSSPSQLFTADVVLLAASRGNNAVLNFLRKSGADMTVCRDLGASALHAAAYEGHETTCELLIEMGLPVDGHPDAQHIPSPLHLATIDGHLGVIGLLLRKKANLMRCVKYEDAINWIWVFRNAYRAYPMSICSPIGVAVVNPSPWVYRYFVGLNVGFPAWAAYYGAHRIKSFDYVRCALKADANPNWVAENGLSTLHAALAPNSQDEKAESVRMVDILLTAGAKLTGGEIYGAIALNDANLIERILTIDPWNVDAASKFMEILEIAIIHGNWAIAEEVFAKYPNAYSPQVLCASVLFADESPGTVERLVNNAPTSEVMSDLESLAIGMAALLDREYILDLLLTKFQGASQARLPREPLFALINEAMWDSSTNCVVSRLPGILELYRLRKEPFWHMQHTVLGSPLVLALCSGESLSRLLDHGFPPDRLTMAVAFGIKRQCTIEKLVRCNQLLPGSETEIPGPLWMAIMMQFSEVAKRIVETWEGLDEDYNLIPRGRSPLQKAVELFDLDMITYLLNKGAHINAPAAEVLGATALQLAAMTGQLGVAKMLVDQGADINACGATTGGRTALEGAAEQGRIDTVYFLLSKGVEIRDEGRISYLRSIRYAEEEGNRTAANLLRDYREWTAEDDELWAVLQSLPKEECEDNNGEIDSSSSFFSSPDLNSPDEEDSEYGHIWGPFSEDSFADDVDEDEDISSPNHVSESSAELLDLEELTSDPFAFWPRS
ncbi:Ankyrin-3 [Colletotrichum tropicale]|nr:Ankyrin-3 [Colletotrichum tropicale]